LGDTRESIAHGLSVNAKGKGLFSLFGVIKNVRTNIMIQSLFDNGFRLITTDLKYGSTKKPTSIEWNTPEKANTFSSLLESHL